MALDILAQELIVDESAGLTDDDKDPTIAPYSTNTTVQYLLSLDATGGLTSPQVAFQSNFVVASASAGESISSVILTQNSSGTPFSTTVGVNSGIRTVDGNYVWLFQDATYANIVIGVIGTSDIAAEPAETGPLAFSFALVSTSVTNSDLYTVEYVPLLHPNATNPDDQIDLADKVFASISATTTASFTGQNADPGKHEFYLLDSPSDASKQILVTGFLGAANAIPNVSTQGFGVDNQSINPTEKLQVDFVTGGTLHAGSASQIQYGSHVETITQAGFTINQITPSSPDKRVDITITALNVQGNEQGLNFYDGSPTNAVDITSVKLTSVPGTGSNFATIITADGDYVTASGTVHVSGLTGTGNAVTITGLDNITTVDFTTASPIDRLLITGVDANEGCDITEFHFQTTSPNAHTEEVGSFINFDDDGPSATANQVTGTVDEDGVIENLAVGTQTGDGIAGGPAGAGSFGDVSGEAVTATGSVTSLFLSGADSPLTYLLKSDTSGLPSLTSGGTAVAYSVVDGVDDTLIGYRSGGNPNTAADQVFTFVLQANGDWTFTLIDQLDHASLNNQSGDNLENDLTMDLSSILQAKDADLDPVTASPNALVITVDDDTPTQNNSLVSGTVDEDGVIENVAVGTQTGDGIASGVGDVANENVTATGSIAALFNSGADEPLVYGLSATTSGLPSLASGGVAVLYSVTGSTLTAYRTGGSPANAADQVFTFTITDTSTGAYSFTLIDQLDHDSLNELTGDDTENDLLIQLGSIVQATDKDGDTITYVPAGDNTNGVVITVDDDTPTQNNSLVSGTVDEDGVIENVAVGTQTGDGIAGGVDDVAGAIVIATGSIAALFNSGADEPLVYGLSATTSGLPTLASGGVAVLYSVTGNTLTAYRTGGSPGNTADQVFTFSINTSTGAYSFTLIDQLDHDSLNGLTGDDTENDLLIQLGSILQATDKDGDTITYVPAGDNTNGLLITVDDDMPALSGGTASVRVEEDELSPSNTPADLSTGNTDGDIPTDVATFSNSDLQAIVSSGADEPVTFALNLLVSGAVLDSSGSAVTSKGDALSWSVSAGVVQAVAGGRVIFTVEQTAGGATATPTDDVFTVNLQDQIDHGDASGDNGTKTLDLTPAFTATDFDGDLADLNGANDAQRPIQLVVENDVPTAVPIVTITKEVMEDALSGGNTPDAGDSETKTVNATISSSDLNSLANIGADEPMAFSLNSAVIGTNVVTTGGDAVLSQGANVVWAAGATLGSLKGVATIGGVSTTIFTLTPSGSNFVFTLAEQVDHAGTDDDLELLGLDLTPAFSGVDSDKDPVTLNNDSIVVNVENDLPIFNGQTSSQTLDWVDDNFVTGSLNGKVGSDDTGSYIIDKYTDLADYTENLSLDGKTLTYSKDGKVYFTLALDDAANGGAGGYTFTVNEPASNPPLNIDFKDLDSGQNLFGTVAFDKTDINNNGTPGNLTDDFMNKGGLLTFPSNPDINDGEASESNDGTMTNTSGTTNTSKGGGPVTIGNMNQAFDHTDEGAWFLYVDKPHASAVSGVGLNANLADDADNIQFNGTVDVRTASVEIVQASGAGTTKRPGPGMHIEAWDLNPGDVNTGAEARDVLLDPTTMGGSVTGTQVNIIGVKVINTLTNAVVEYWKDVGTINGVYVLQGADSPVNFTFIEDSPGIFSVTVSNLKANYAIEWETETDHNAALTENTGGSYDIGGFNLLQGIDSADVDFEFSVALQDKDGDVTHFNGTTDIFDDFKIKVDGTGVNNDPSNVAPTGFATSYDTAADALTLFAAASLKDPGLVNDSGMGPSIGPQIGAHALRALDLDLRQSFLFSDDQLPHLQHDLLI